MQLFEATLQNQIKLANYCRNGILPKISGIKYKNLPQYRRLVYNAIDDMLQNAYPLTSDLLQEDEWESAVNDFFSSHKCQSPQVWYMPKEFYEFLSITRHPLLLKYPFLEELLQFEWTEVELFMMPDQRVEFSASGDLNKDKLVLNPEHRLLAFQFPVHRRNCNSISVSDKGNYFAVAHRNNEGFVVFTDITPALVRMLEYLTEEPLNLKELFEAFETEYNVQLSSNDQQNIIDFFKNSLNQQLIIGFSL